MLQMTCVHFLNPHIIGENYHQIFKVMYFNIKTLLMWTHTHTHVHMHRHSHTHTHIYMYINTHIESERDIGA